MLLTAWATGRGQNDYAQRIGTWQSLWEASNIEKASGIDYMCQHIGVFWQLLCSFFMRSHKIAHPQATCPGKSPHSVHLYTPLSGHPIASGKYSATPRKLSCTLLGNSDLRYHVLVERGLPCYCYVSWSGILHSLYSISCDTPLKLKHGTWEIDTWKGKSTGRWIFVAPPPVDPLLLVAPLSVAVKPAGGGLAWWFWWDMMGSTQPIKGFLWSSLFWYWWDFLWFFYG